jgi:hypothetical protein
MIENCKNKSKQSNKYNSSMLPLLALSRGKCLLSEDSQMYANQQSTQPSIQSSLHPTYHPPLLLPEERKLPDLLLNEHHK